MGFEDFRVAKTIPLRLEIGTRIASRIQWSTSLWIGHSVVDLSHLVSSFDDGCTIAP